MMQNSSMFYLTFFILLPINILGYIQSPRPLVTRSGASYSPLLSSPSPNDEARSLQEQAEKLRGEVAAFERSKSAEIDEAYAKKRVAADTRQKKQERHSAVVPINKGDGSEVMERVFFRPLLGDGSRIVAVEARLPLGAVLGEHETIAGATSVDDLDGTGNAASAGIEVGDVLRACSACQVTMTQPTWQLIVGGIGQPKTNRMMFDVDGKPFEEVMSAVGSNRMDPEGRAVWLVVERA
mmetsp:Transcript_13104/g.20052  ORF Transcript_13104/g.20052 Transcript_13104/m.20052 type:complete len:238 (+) Transcript_13104:52-765(+)